MHSIGPELQVFCKIPAMRSQPVRVNPTVVINKVIITKVLADKLLSISMMYVLVFLQLRGPESIGGGDFPRSL